MKGLDDEMNETGDVVDDIGDDVILTTRQAAALCRVSEERIRTLAGDGRVPATMAHHAWSFSARDLHDILEHHPEILYARRSPQIVTTVALRASRSATMLRVHAMRTAQERHEAGLRGHRGLLAKLARQIDPDNLLPQQERDHRVSLLFQAHMADVRAAQQRNRKLTTKEERIAEMMRAAEVAENEENETAATVKARRTATTSTTSTTSIAAGGDDSLQICFDCWRERWRGRVPAGLTNKLCAPHQRALDAFAAQLRAAS